MDSAVKTAEPNGPQAGGGDKPPVGSHQIVILGVAGSNPVSHPLFGSVSDCVADVRRGEPSAVYHADADYRNASRVKTFLDSPLLYWRRYVSPSPLPGPSGAGLELGTLVHGWLEEGDSFLDSLAVPPAETLTSTGLLGKDAKKWVADNFGQDAKVVSPAVYAQVQHCIRAIRDNPAAMRLIDRLVEREVSVRWTTPGGDRLRCRFDGLTSDGLVVDLKTTSDASILADFWRSVLKWKYHFSEAWYRRGMEACGMEPAPLRYIVVSTVQPHDCHVVTLPPYVVAEGQRLMDAALAELRTREDLGWWQHDCHGEEVELSFPGFFSRGGF